MNEIFEKVLQCRALSVIHYLALDHLDFPNDPKTTDALKAISETNDLDLAWAIAHEQLGQLDKAAELRKWVKDKAARKKAFE